MQGSAKQDLLHRIEGDSNGDDSDGDLSCGVLRSYDEVVNCLLATYSNESSILKANLAITDLKQHENQSPIGFKDVIVAKTSRCGKVYVKAHLINCFRQGLSDNVQHQVCYYYSEHSTATLDTLARYAND